MMIERPLTIVIAATFTLGACSSTHLQPSERAALQSMFGDQREPRPLDGTSVVGRAGRGDGAALHQLFVKSLGASLDGESAETYIYDLSRVLFELGDSRFSVALAAEPQRTRDAVLNSLIYVFFTRHLSYPQTESLSSDPPQLRSGMPVTTRKA